MIIGTNNTTSRLIFSDNNNNQIATSSNLTATSSGAKLEVAKYLLNFRKVRLVNESFSRFSQDIDIAFITPNQKNTNSYLLGFDVLLEINSDVTEKIIEDITIDNIRWYPEYPSGQLAAATKGLFQCVEGGESLAVVVFSGVLMAMMNSTLYSYHRDVIEAEAFYINIEEQKKNYDLSFFNFDLPNIKIEYSPFNKMNLSLIFVALCKNFSLSKKQFYPMVKAFYLGLMATWINLNSSENSLTMQLITITELKKLNNMLTNKIIYNTLSILGLDRELNSDKEIFNNDRVENSQYLTEAITLIKQESQESSNNDKTFNAKNMEQQIATLKSLAEGCYFMKSTTTSGIIRVNNSRDSLSKYAFYQPINEMEYTTNSADVFANMLKKANVISYYPLDIKIYNQE